MPHLHHNNESFDDNLDDGKEARGATREGIGGAGWKTSILPNEPIFECGIRKAEWGMGRRVRLRDFEGALTGEIQPNPSKSNPFDFAQELRPNPS